MIGRTCPRPSPPRLLPRRRADDARLGDEKNERREKREARLCIASRGEHSPTGAQPPRVVDGV